MKYLPFGQLIKFIFIIYKHKGIPFRLWPHSIPWLVKCIFLEPFRWFELIIFERKIQRHMIPFPPVFILGHYRSGTTYLQRILIQSGKFGHMTIFQSGLPEIMLSCEKWLTPILQIMSNIFKVQNHFHRIPMTWNFPGEEDVGLAALMFRNSPQWGMLFPSFFFDYEKYIGCSNITSRDTKHWVSGYVYLVKKISLANKGKQLILKSPPNTARILLLQQIFPGARFIFLHRNPYDVFSSTQRFMKVVKENYALGVMPEELSTKIIEKEYSFMMDKYLQESPHIPRGNLIELAYDDLLKHPLAVAQTVFDQLGINGWHESKTRIANFIEQNKGHIPLEHNQNTEIEKQIGNQWKKYILHWKYALRN